MHSKVLCSDMHRLAVLETSTGNVMLAIICPGNSQATCNAPFAVQSNTGMTSLAFAALALLLISKVSW